jgi:CubicO group peptidase (beta-lactamase class C family)
VLTWAGPLEERIQRIEKRWQPVRRMAELKVPAVSMVVIKDGSIEWMRAYGVAVTTESLFQAASISKPVAAMAALHMAQNGNFGIDENVNDKLVSWKVPDNEFTKEKKVTLRGILSHSAGLTVSGFPGYAEHEKVATLLQVLNGEPPTNTAPIRVDVTPGTLYRYSGGGYTVLQQLMIDRFKKPFPELMRTIVLGTLGMRSSTYEQPLPEDRRARAAVGFRENGRSIAGGWHTYPEMAAAGLWTTPSDLARFAIEVQKSIEGKSNKVVQREFAKLMVTPQVGRHGLGLVMQGEGAAATFGHGGSNAGYRCQLEASMDGKWGMVVMTNSDTGQELINQVMKAVREEYQWPQVK